MLRKDREITSVSAISAILDRCEVLRLGLCDENTPYVVPVNFGVICVENRIEKIYFHCAKIGRKLDIIDTNPHVCFETDRVERFEKNDKGCSWTCRYESVIGYGVAHIIKDDDEKKTALDAIMKKYANEVVDYNPEIFSKTAAVCIDVESISGKSNIK